MVRRTCHSVALGACTLVGPLSTPVCKHRWLAPDRREPPSANAPLTQCPNPVRAQCAQHKVVRPRSGLAPQCASTLQFAQGPKVLLIAGANAHFIARTVGLRSLQSGVQAYGPNAWLGWLNCGWKNKHKAAHPNARPCQRARLSKP